MTHFGASPTLIRGLAADCPDAEAAGSCETVRLLITSGEVIDPEHMIWFHQSLGRGVCPVINYTGGTEVSGGLLSNVVVRPIVAAAFNSIWRRGLQADVLERGGPSGARPHRRVVDPGAVRRHDAVVLERS